MDVSKILNKFHENVKFTYEVKQWQSFLDVLIMKNKGKLETNGFRKESNNGIYLHWWSFAPIT